MSGKEALNILFEQTPIELIYDTYDTPEFFEFHGSAGGDSLCYRVYKKNGMVTSR